MQAKTARPLDRRAQARLQRVEEHVRCENAHDLDGVMSTFGATGFYDDAPWGERHEGLEAVRAFYADLIRVAPDFHIDVKTRHAATHAVILELQLTGTHRGTWRGLPGTGRRFDIPICAVFTFDEQDRMLGERIYYDRAAVLQQLGVRADPASLSGRLATVLLHPITVVGSAVRSLLHR